MPTAPHKPSPGTSSEIRLTQEEFDTLEKLGGVKLRDEIRADINDTLAVVTGGAWKRPTNQLHHEKKRQLQKLRASVAKLIHDLRVAEATDIPGQEGSVLELWRANLPVEANIAAETNLLSHFEHTLAMLHEALECGIEKLGPKPVTSGRRENQRLKYLIASLAVSYVRAGGKPSASYQQLQRRRNTRFLRVLCFINERLPSSCRAHSEEALKDMAHRVIREHKAWREQSGLSRWGTKRPRKGRNAACRDSQN